MRVRKAEPAAIFRLECLQQPAAPDRTDNCCHGLLLCHVHPPANATQLKNLRVMPSTRKTLVSVKAGTSSQIRCSSRRAVSSLGESRVA